MRLASLVRAVLAGVAGLLLCGCILSPEPLLDAASAVTPLSAGTYQAMARQDDGTFAPEEDNVQIELNGNVYTMIEGEDRLDFTLHEAPGGLLIGMTTDKDTSETGYAVLRLDCKEIVFWAAVCEVAEDGGIVEKYPGIETDGLSCTIPDRDTLVAFLSDYAAVAQADFRYVPLGR